MERKNASVSTDTLVNLQLVVLNVKKIQTVQVTIYVLAILDWHSLTVQKFVERRFAVREASVAKQLVSFQQTVNVQRDMEVILTYVAKT